MSEVSDRELPHSQLTHSLEVTASLPASHSLTHSLTLTLWGGPTADSRQLSLTHSLPPSLPLTPTPFMLARMYLHLAFHVFLTIKLILNCEFMVIDTYTHTLAGWVGGWHKVVVVFRVWYMILPYFCIV